MTIRSHHAQHPLFPSERSPRAALTQDTMAAVLQGEAQREQEYQRYLAMRETPEYQALLAAARARRGGK